MDDVIPATRKQICVKEMGNPSVHRPCIYPSSTNCEYRKKRTNFRIISEIGSIMTTEGGYMMPIFDSCVGECNDAWIYMIWKRFLHENKSTLLLIGEEMYLCDM